MSENFRDEEAIKRPKHRLTLLPLALTLGCAFSTREMVASLEDNAAKLEAAKYASADEPITEPDSEQVPEEDVPVEKQGEQEEQVEQGEQEEQVEQGEQDEQGEQVEEVGKEGDSESAPLPTELRGEILVHSKFPATVEIKDLDSSPGSDSIVYGLPRDRDSYIDGFVVVLIRDKKTGSVVSELFKEFKSSRQEYDIRFPIPKLPKGEYDVEVKTKIKYLSDGEEKQYPDEYYRELTVD